MKKLIFTIIAFSALVGCTPKAERGGGGGSKNATVKTIEANIDKMKGSPWSHKAYDEILKNQIEPSTVLRAAQKDALKSKLEMVYSGAIYDEASAILNSNCGSGTHSRLNASIKEIDAHPKASGYAQLKDQYKVHQDELAFAKTIHASQAVSNWDTHYDASFETKKRSEVAAHRAKNPKCTELQKAFSDASVNSAFTGRRQRFAKAIVDKYCQETEWSKGDENKICNRVREALKGSIPSDLQTKIDNFRAEHQPKE